MRRDLIKIYNYIYVVAKAQGVFGDADHRELINKYSQEGWKFTTAIRNDFDGHGIIKQYDLVFEKEN